MRKITKIIIHCSDSDYKQHDNVETIRSWHVYGRGWKDIGYHYVITKDGKIHQGRDVEKSGAHARGHNHDSIGICLTGKNDFSEAQFDSLAGFLANSTVKKFLGHREVSNKTCPNFDVHEMMAQYGIISEG